MNDLDLTEEIENNDVTISQEEYLRYKRAFELLETVEDDYENYGEVLQDETIEEIVSFFTGIDEEDAGEDWAN